MPFEFGMQDKVIELTYTTIHIYSMSTQVNRLIEFGLLF